MTDGFLSGKGEKESSSMSIKALKRRINWSVLLLILILSVFLFDQKTLSSEVPKDPFPRIEMGMHTSIISSIGVDAQNQFIVTGSQDKTVRLWELSTGRLLKIFRPPIGEGPVGMIFAVAISSDGKTIACGGRTESGEGASLAGKTILFIDTCHAGNIMGARAVATDITGIVNELASAENGAVVFASSTGRQYSFEDLAWGNGAFTKAVVEGISGKADYTGKGKITINMLDLYISERVKELTGGKQTPATAKPQTIPDFPLVLKR